MAKRKAWDRCIELGEGHKSHELFWEYVSLGTDRSYQAVAERTGRKVQTVTTLGGKFHWVKRARAYDSYLRKIQDRTIENTIKSEAVLFAERSIAYRNESHEFSRRLFQKAGEMLEAPLYITEIVESQEVKVNGVTVTVPLTVIRKPVNWKYRDLVAIADLSDKMRRLSLGVPTSRTAVEVTPALTLEERIGQARAAMKFWQDNKLERAIQRMMAEDPSQDPEDIRQNLLAESYLWFAEDHRIDDPSLLLTAGDEEPPPALSLDDEAEPDATEAVN